MEEKLNKRQQQAAQTKDKLMRSASRLFSTRGYENTKISDICKDAEISVGNFYHYFPGKDHLYLAMYASFDEFAERVLSQKKYASHLEAIRDLLAYQVTAAQNTTPAIQAQLFQAQLNTHGGYVVMEDRFIHTYMKNLLRQGIEAGEIHPSHDVDRTAQLLFQVSRGILFDWAMRGGTFDRGAQVNLALDLILSSLEQPKPSEKPNVDLTDYENWQAEYFKEKGWRE